MLAITIDFFTHFLLLLLLLPFATSATLLVPSLGTGTERERMNWQFSVFDTSFIPLKCKESLDRKYKQIPTDERTGNKTERTNREKIERAANEEWQKGRARKREIKAKEIESIIMCLAICLPANRSNRLKANALN